MQAILNLLGILKERFEVERVELEVVACLSMPNFTQARSCDDRLSLMGRMGKREWATENRERRNLNTRKL